MKFSLTLPIPPSVNRMRRFTGKRKGRPSDQLVFWKGEAFELIQRRKPLPYFTGNVHITYAFYYKDARAGDNNNYTKAATDILIEYGILKDDRHTILRSEHVFFAGYDKDNPRLEITLEAVG